MTNIRIPKRFAAVTLACLLVLSFAPARADGVTAIRCGRLLNPVDGSITPNAVIVVNGEHIEQVGANAKIPDGARVIDLSAYTVLPGLIDSHTHILLQPEDERGAPPVITKSQAFRTVQGVAAARKDLEAGFTTLRDVDSEGAGFADVAIRDAINRGIVPGPRLLVSTMALTITGGHMNNAGLNPDIYIPEPASLTDSREAMVAEVRRQVKYGADWIKLYATGTLRHVDAASLEPLGQVSLDDVKAVVAEAKRWHRDVAAHAYGGEGAKNAIRGGVRSLEHGMMLDDEALKLMVEQGTYWCPTLSVYFPETEEDNTEVRRRILASHKNVFQKAMKLGVKIVFGTDVGAFEHGTSAREFVRMVEYGMKPIDAIRSATVRAAELLRLEREIGTIEAGKFADVIAVEGNPLDDIRTLSRVQFVMKAGQVYKSPR
ncbi:MAG TPA: amidohydrolase family protein [Steroidobacteraceae bacterium]|jgi:imidazolonepropionase-like amidohydrolase|nr:amidohydrolase family protein [Steroidobacteraceae bacterium]